MLKRRKRERFAKVPTPQVPAPTSKVDGPRVKVDLKSGPRRENRGKDKGLIWRAHKKVIE